MQASPFTQLFHIYKVPGSVQGAEQTRRPGPWELTVKWRCSIRVSIHRVPPRFRLGPSDGGGRKGQQGESDSKGMAWRWTTVHCLLEPSHGWPGPPAASSLQTALPLGSVAASHPPGCPFSSPTLCPYYHGPAIQHSRALNHAALRVY